MSFSKLNDNHIVEGKIGKKETVKKLIKITLIDSFLGAYSIFKNGKCMGTVERECSCFESTGIFKIVPHKKEHSPNNRGNQQTVHIYYVGPGQCLSVKTNTISIWCESNHIDIPMPQSEVSVLSDKLHHPEGMTPSDDSSNVHTSHYTYHQLLDMCNEAIRKGEDPPRFSGPQFERYRQRRTT